jgi:uncharacterized protein YjbJ (UPF0337 family)
MNKYTLKGDWNQLKGKALEKWGELTNDELDQMKGQSDQLVGAIQKRYGLTVDEAQREVDEWNKSL